MAQLDPNIILAAGRGAQPLDFGQLLQQRNQIKLANLAVQKETQARDALDRVKADPSDMTALSDLAAVNPQAAQGYLAVQAAGRASQFRGAQSQFIRAMDPTVRAAAAPADPAAAPTPAAPTAQPGEPSASPGTPADPAKGDSHFLDPRSPATATIGAAAATGKISPTEALAQMAQYADPGQLEQSLGIIKSMDEVRLSHLTEANNALGTAAQTLLTQTPGATPDQRRAVAMRMAPALAAHGVSADQIANADFSDAGLHGLIGQAIGVQGLIEQANKDRTASMEERKQTETERHNRVDEHKPVSQSFGTNLVDPITGKVVADGSGGMGAGGGTQYTGGWTPRARNGGDNSDASVDNKITGVAQILGVKPGDDISKLDPAKIARALAYGEGANDRNNPTNLRAGDGSYARYNSQAAGIAAAAAQVQRNLSRGQTTVQSMIEGLPVGGSGQIRAAAGLSADTLTNGADYMIAHGGDAPTGFSRDKAARAALQNAFTLRMKDKGITMDDVIKGGQDLKSGQATLTEFTKGKSAATVRSLNVAVDHLDQLQQASKALQNGNVPLFNRLAQGFAKETGSAVPTNFDAIKDFVTDEVTKAIIGSGGGVGDREKASNLISRANSPSQLSGAIEQIQGLMGGQLNGLRRQYEQGTKRTDFERFVSPRAAQVLERHTASAAPAGATKTATGPNGTKAYLVSGRWVDAKGNPIG